MSLFPKEDILTKEEIESWKSFGDSLSSKEDPFTKFQSPLGLY